MIKISNLSIRCISHPSFDQGVFLDFLNENGLTWIQKGNATEAEHLVEASGRLCYMSFGEQNQSPRNTNEYIMNLIVQGHESVLEHLNWTFLITGVSRAFTHQLVRHRAGFSYSQLSQQYHDESEAEFVVPIEVILYSLMHGKNRLKAALNFIKPLSQTSVLINNRIIIQKKRI